MAGSQALRLRRWQTEALAAWESVGRRGIVSVVTGGGKTVFALAAIQAMRPPTVLIVVPTVALLDQWWEEASCFLGLEMDDFHIISGNRRMRSGTVNLAVLNTASQLHDSGRAVECLLIIDECHKAASPKFSAVLDLPKLGALGLSATPERQYDDGLEELLVPRLGPVIYRYTYRDAMADNVIVPFDVVNVVFELDAETREQYDKLTKAIGRSVQKWGGSDEKTVALLLRRTRIMNLSMERVRLALRIVARHQNERVLVFHEDIRACNLIYEVLRENGVAAGVYHSKLGLRVRASMLADYRRGSIRVLVTCRALDEGFNVPETTIGIIAASTATRRQRIQRLGRILRPADGKLKATVYTLVATTPEIQRLQEEVPDLEGVARVIWSKA